MAANQERDFYQEAASLLTGARTGTLATISGGGPHAALVTPAMGTDGAPVLLLSELSAHTRHLRANPACALLITGTPADENPQTAPRILLSGIAQRTDDPDAATRFLKTHSYANLYFGFGDFHFWRLIASDAHYVGGFAAAAPLEIAALQHKIMYILGKGAG
jgi:putative heme iron utilization protein